jgi:hypothetical protein
MTTDIEESQQGVQAQFFRELDSCAAALHQFKPDLVVVFGPDHFNGFFYELMPAFCIGTAAEHQAGISKADRCRRRATWRSLACNPQSRD